MVESVGFLEKMIIIYGWKTMAVVTAFGKILRKMRIDCSEVLGAMASRLGVSAAYLSSIENGGREIPDSLVAKIAQVYGLHGIQNGTELPFVADFNLYTADEETLSRFKMLPQSLEEAKAKVKGAVDVNFQDQKAQENYVETAVMFAKDFSRLSAAQVNELKELLKKFESSGEYSNGSVSM